MRFQSSALRRYTQYAAFCLVPLQLPFLKHNLHCENPTSSSLPVLACKQAAQALRHIMAAINLRMCMPLLAGHPHQQPSQSEAPGQHGIHAVDEGLLRSPDRRAGRV